MLNCSKELVQHMRRDFVEEIFFFNSMKIINAINEFITIIRMTFDLNRKICKKNNAHRFYIQFASTDNGNIAMQICQL